MKKLLMIGGVLIAVVIIAIAVALGYLYSNKDELIRKGTEYGMSYVLEVPVTVGGAALDIGAGSLQFDDIIIPNPDGYNSRHAMAFGIVRVEADVNSLISGDVKIINLIQVSQSDIILEQKGGSSNLQDLMASSTRFSSGEQATSDEEETSNVKLQIDKIIVDGTQVGVQLPIVDKEVGVKIPDYEITDIGGEDKETVTPAEAIQEFIASILAQITEYGNGILPADFLKNITGDLKNLPGEVLNSLTEQLGSLTDSFKTGSIENLNVDGTVSDVTDTANETVEDAKESLDKAAEDVENSVDEAADKLKNLF